MKTCGRTPRKGPTMRGMFQSSCSALMNIGALDYGHPRKLKMPPGFQQKVEAGAVGLVAGGVFGPAAEGGGSIVANQNNGAVALRRVICFRNAKEIGDYIGEHERAIPKLVIDEGLPAWKRRGDGAWRALDWHCDMWLLQQAAKYTPQAGADAARETSVNS